MTPPSPPSPEVGGQGVEEEAPGVGTLDDLAFDNRFVNELPGDPDPSPHPRQVFGAAWSPVRPSPVSAPRLLAWSPEAATLLGLSAREVTSERFARVFGGCELLDGMEPWAAAYGGHQFGVWAGQLGDGRAISLGEAVTPGGERWELQLKGAGPTPYSRRADGRAVLRSSIREFLCSEAMHHLGVPTTRALSLVGTGESVMRDMFYDGNPAPEPGAVVCRMAPSFLRPGNFQLFAARGEVELLGRLVDFCIHRDFPHLEGAWPDVEERRAAWFAEICERSADLVVHWMRVGFVHGVLNTDNLSVLGLTLDYGPYGWLEAFDPDWTPNTTDAGRRRYRYGNQPAVVQWNLVRFAEALREVFPEPALLEEGLNRYVERYNKAYPAMTAAKFGLAGPGALRGEGGLDVGRAAGVQGLVRDGFRLLREGEGDFTRFFRALGEEAGEGTETEDHPRVLSGEIFRDGARREAVRPAFQGWLARWRTGVRNAWEGAPPDRVRQAMHQVNPRYVLRNWLVHEAIQMAEDGDLSRVHALLEVVRRPYADQPEYAGFDALPPAWARDTPGCGMLSCSS